MLAIKHQEAKAEERLSGAVEKILFQDLSSGYTVLLLSSSPPATRCVVTGVFPSVVPGHQLELTGVWKVHPRFGKQFEASTFYSTTPTSRTGLISYLGSGFIKGIGPHLAERLVEVFGLDVLVVIDKEPHRLQQISGLGEKRISAISIAWQEQKELAHIMIFLQDKGLSARYATKLYKRYRGQTIVVLQENPYRLVDDIWGIGFVIADEIAQKMGIDPHSFHRVSAGLRYSLKKAAQQGHLYLKEEDLLRGTSELLAIEQAEKVTEIFERLCEQKQLVKIHTEHELIALPVAYNAECTVALLLSKILSTPAAHTISHEFVTEIVQAQHSHMPYLTEEQRDAIVRATTQKITIITGGPGTGKTTILSALLKVLDSCKLKYKLAAPTGRAAVRMRERTGHAATTLHRLLEFDPELMQFKYNETRKLQIDFLIIDECSMIDIMLAQAATKALPAHSCLILIGDSDQLPPVGPGNFFRDCMQSSIIPVVRLTRVFRQGEGSLIAYNAHRIKDGLFPVAETDGDTRPDYLFIPHGDSVELSVQLKRVLAVEVAVRGHDLKDVITLCPMHKGSAGTQQLNSFLQELYNPGIKTSFVFGGNTFKLNDRVMQLRNNYDKFVFNGDIGIIESINQEDKSFVVLYDGRQASYQFEEASELSLAYAISIHKSQGSEFPVVVIPLYMQHFMMLKRNLLYTAITRAQKLCIIIGEKRALAIALQKAGDAGRITLLSDLLSGKIPHDA